MSQVEPFSIGKFPLFVLFLISVMSIYAQSDTGRLQGTALDPIGAVVPGASITITNQATGRSSNATIDTTNGTFTVPGLPVGR